VPGSRAKPTQLGVQASALWLPAVIPHSYCVSKGWYHHDEGSPPSSWEASKALSATIDKNKNPGRGHCNVTAQLRGIAHIDNLNPIDMSHQMPHLEISWSADNL